MSLISRFAQISNDFDSFNTEFNTTTDTTTGAEAAVAVGFLLFMLFFWVVFYVFFSFCLMKIFQKANRKDAWAAWIPVYNSWVMFEVAGRPGWWAIASFIPIVGLVLSIIAMIDLAKSFGKGGGFAALLILLPVIGMPILAFGSDKYIGPAGPDGVKPAPPAAA